MALAITSAQIGGVMLSRFDTCGKRSQSCKGILLASLLATIACSGSAGQDGTQGPAGPPGQPGADASTVVDYGVLTPGELEIANLAAEIQDVVIPADGQPVVTVKVTERHGRGVRGVAPTATSWRFAMIKLNPAADGIGNDTWVSYMAANDKSTAGTETANASGLTDLADGTYRYRFTKNITAGPAAAGTKYEPAKVHRLVLLLSATGNPFTPVNAVKEFVPSTGTDVTGKNDKVDGKACLECHTQFRATSGATGELGSGQFHGGVRFDVRTCAACHNDQKLFAATNSGPDSPVIASDGTWKGEMTVMNGEAFVNLPVFIHKIHMGEELKMTG